MFGNLSLRVCVCLSCFHNYPRRSAETTKMIVYCLFSLPLFLVPPGLVCMKSSSSVVELVMLLCSQASLASLSFLILVLHSPPTSRLTLSAVNPHSGHAEPYLSSTLPRPPFSTFVPSPDAGAGNRRGGIYGRKYWSEGQGWPTCPRHL